MNSEHGAGRRDCAPPGLERAIWRRIPALLFYGTLGPVMVALTWRWSAPATRDREIESSLLLMDFTMIGVVALCWTLVLTLALGCRIVMIMKGPVQWADPYPLHDREAPGPARPIGAARADADR